MPNPEKFRFAGAMEVIEASIASDQFARGLLSDLLDADGRVRFKSIVSFHDHLCQRYGFSLVQNAKFGVLPGGRHLFYKRGNILVRVKTSGTKFRPTPHMTISLVTGLKWEEEFAKLSRHGDLIPKLGAVGRAGHRALKRLGGDFETLTKMDDHWADECHFNFVKGLDVTGAPALRVQ